MDMSQQPLIEYPCQWEYKIIGLDAVLMRSAVAAVLESLAYTIEPSHQSSGGKYVSLTVQLTVTDEAFRHRIFEELKSQPAIRMVL
jgi:putative lipoic acid-binding regulatory protein